MFITVSPLRMTESIRNPWSQCEASLRPSDPLAPSPGPFSILGAPLRGLDAAQLRASDPHQLQGASEEIAQAANLIICYHIYIIISYYLFSYGIFLFFSFSLPIASLIDVIMDS